MSFFIIKQVKLPHKYYDRLNPHRNVLPSGGHCLGLYSKEGAHNCCELSKRKLTLCQWDGDDHTVSGSDPETISADQKRCDSHEREAQLAGACESRVRVTEGNDSVKLKSPIKMLAITKGYTSTCVL